MKAILFNDNWKLWEEKDAFALNWAIPENARSVDLPHDIMIEKDAYAESKNGGNTGYRDSGNYTYAKVIFIPEDAKNKVYKLKFEGVYMNAFVYVNGQLAAKNPFGYSTFYVELNNYLKYGQNNEIFVQVRAGAMPNSRWYSGCGIYRDVYMLESDKTYIEADHVRIETEDASSKLAQIKIMTEINNMNSETQKVILKSVIKNNQGEIVASDQIPIILFINERRTVTQRIVVKHPMLWSEDTPNLYTCESVLIDENGATIDEQVEKFGIRTISVDSNRGLLVNGQSVKLRGACVHHDSGLLGAATYEEVHMRQIRKMKEAGFNAIRMSHHPMAPAMLRACDQLGMYVMDETFDMWTRVKSDFDYGQFFSDYWEKDVESMVYKDFNHPSVIMYSIGNEIPEIGTAAGAKLCHEICAKIKSIDSKRFTLASINGIFSAGDAIGQITADIVSDLTAKGEIEGNVNNFMTLMEKHLDKIVVHPLISERLDLACASTDIAGYNYMTARYEQDGELYPNRVIVGSETYPPEIARNWDLVEKLPYVIGDFTWTGWDYIGEAGLGIPAYQWGEGGFGAQFPAQLAYPGDLDLTGFRRPASYFREIVFGRRTKPYIAVQDPKHYGEFLIKTPWIISDTVSSWNWQGYENKPVVVEVYSPGETVALFINGNCIGEKGAGKKAGYRTLFDTIYEPGEIVAVAYDEYHNEVEREVLQTANKNIGIRISLEEMMKNTKLAYFNIELCDDQGHVVTDQDQCVEVEIENAQVIGFGSGDPKPQYQYHESITKLWNGRAQLIVKNLNNDTIIKIKDSTDQLVIWSK